MYSSPSNALFNVKVKRLIATIGPKRLHWTLNAALRWNKLVAPHSKSGSNIKTNLTDYKRLS